MFVTNEYMDFNRYIDILPCKCLNSKINTDNDTRVKLGESKFHDYINANYIHVSNYSTLPPNIYQPFTNELLNMYRVNWGKIGDSSELRDRRKIL